MTILLDARYYKPTNSLDDEDRLATFEHYVKIRDLVTVFSKDVKTLIQIDLIYVAYELGEVKYWDSRKINISFDKLGNYRKVKEEELPWNKCDKWRSESPWYRLTHEELDRIIYS